MAQNVFLRNEAPSCRFFLALCPKLITTVIDFIIQRVTYTTKVGELDREMENDRQNEGRVQIERQREAHVSKGFLDDLLCPSS